MAWLPICIQISLVPGHMLNSLLARERFVSYVRKDGKIASFPGLQSPNAVEGLVRLLRRMTSGRCWVYIWVDVGRRGTSGEVQSAAR